MHRARRAASVDRLGAAHAGRRRRDPDRRRARPRQSAQRQEPDRSPARSAAERSPAASTASTRSACRSGRRSSPPTSPRRSTTSPMAVIPFEPQLFGTAANNGQMIAEVSSGHRAAEMFLQLAQLADRARRSEEARAACLRRCSTSCERRALTARRHVPCSASVPPLARSPARHAAAAAPAAAPRCRPAPRRRRRRAARSSDAGRAPIPAAGLGAPLLRRRYRRWALVRPAIAPVSAVDSRRSEGYYETKSTIFGALIEAIDLAQLARLDAEFGARGNPRHRQRDHRDQEHRDVDLRAGGTARRHLQRRARLWPARAAARARRHRRHHGERRRHGVHRSRRQDPEDRHPLPRQPAAPQHLPAHRQPGRPPRRRILADLRRAPAGRLARQRHRAAARHRRPGAHHPQVQEGQAHPRAARALRLDQHRRAPKC